MIPQEKLTKEQQIARGQEAIRLLESPLIVEAFANLRANYFEVWSQTPADQVNERDGIYHANRVLSDVQAHLRTVASQGTVAAAQIQKMARNAAK